MSSPLSRRDPRVDLLRGVALLMIFVDHIPGDDLNRFTLRNLGFSDAAEIFVLLAGFASTMAYGGTFDREGTLAGIRRVAMRCLRLYVFQVGMLVLAGALVYAWTRHFNLEPRGGGVGSMIRGGAPAIGMGLTLQSQPPDLNILPLYMVLLGLFPPFYLLLRAHPRIAMSASLALWLATQIDQRLNLTNAIDGHGWFFNPFSWQFLFALGACLALIVRRGPLPRKRWLIALAWAYVAFAFVEAAPWQDWGLPDLSPIAIQPTDKTRLAPLRLIHVVGIIYLFLTWGGLVALLRTSRAHRVLEAIEACGKHSLEVFSLGTMLSLLARLLFRTYGMEWPLQIGVNAVGLAAMVTLGLAMEHTRRAKAVVTAQGQPRVVQEH